MQHRPQPRMHVIHDEEVAPCSSKDTQHQRWRRHFTKVLNIMSRKLRNGKAAGTSNILPEMLKVGAKNEDFVGMLTDLLSAVWEKDAYHTSGWMPFSSLYPRKEICTAATIGEA